MDSITQAVLGASIAGACVPPGQRRKAMLAGAMLGTLPDLDVVIDYGNDVANFTYHRGFSHSLFVLAPFSVLLWLALRRWWAPVREAPKEWLAAISLTLLTHPLLDAHTVYGTQLFWPFPMSPEMWSTIFVIDPLYTLPLVVGVATASFIPKTKMLRAGLVISTLYLSWTWVGKFIVEDNAREALAALGLEEKPMFSTPTPLNSILWRVVVLTDDGYVEGFDSLFVDEGSMQFHRYQTDIDSLNEAADIWAVARLRWFARDFLRVTVENEQLIVADLRMGLEPNYVFTHVVAERGNPHWREIPATLVEFEFANRALDETWDRIWR
ncbi:MAG: metal-dependent hydrolase, partial [Woeseiaceae bacterium]